MIVSVDVAWIEQPQGRLAGFFSLDTEENELRYVGNVAIYKKLALGTRLALEVGDDTYFVELGVVEPLGFAPNGEVDKVIQLRSCEIKFDHQEKRRLSQEIVRTCEAICKDLIDREVEDLQRLLRELKDIENSL